MMSPETLAQDERQRRRSFGVGLGVLVVLAFALRVVVAGSLGPLRGGDAQWYSNLAIDLSQGSGFVDPIKYRFWGETGISLFKPPLWSGVLAIPSALFPDNALAAQRIVACLLGAVMVLLVGLTARRLAGRAAGLFAAALAAVAPNLVMLDGLLLVESIYATTIAAILFVSFRLDRRRDLVSAALLGALIGLGMLQRVDAALIVPLLAVPLFVRIRNCDGFALRAGVAVASMFLILAPWSVYASVKTHSVVVVSSNAGEAIANANCDETWNGRIAGYWSLTCLGKQPDDRGVAYAVRHLESAPRVALQRVGRSFDFYRPFQNQSLATLIDGRPPAMARLGLFVWYAMLPLAILGYVVLKRSKKWTWPLVAMVGLSIVVSVAIHGETRFRVPAVVAVTILAGVALGRLVPSRDAGSLSEEDRSNASGTEVAGVTSSGVVEPDSEADSV